MPIPDDVCLRHLTRVALHVYDVARLLGHVVRFDEWRAQFNRGPRVNAQRMWGRYRRDFKAFDVEYRSVTDTALGYSAPDLVVFPSRDYMYQRVDELIGKPENYVCTSRRTQPSEKQVYDMIEILREERRAQGAAR